MPYSSVLAAYRLDETLPGGGGPYLTSFMLVLEEEEGDGGEQPEHGQKQEEGEPSSPTGPLVLTFAQDDRVSCLPCEGVAHWKCRRPTV